MKKVVFSGEECIVRATEYYDGNRAIVLETLDGEMMCVATVNVNFIHEEDQVVIKNYSENEGILEVLVEAGVISEPLRETRFGYVTAPVCRFLGVD